jgi:hypothetical protein
MTNLEPFVVFPNGTFFALCRKMFRKPLVGCVVATVLTACTLVDDSPVPIGESPDGKGDGTGQTSRDWRLHPSIVSVDAGPEVYAVSDPHGHYQLFATLLANNRLIANVAADPSTARWTGGTAILVIAGDLIDKGPESLKVIDLVRTLERSAGQSGGQVITTMGNHEAEFLLDPRNKKATSTGVGSNGIDNELAGARPPISPESVVAGTDAQGRGAWISNLPFGVRIGKWFFAHGGNTQQLSLQKLSQKLQNSVDRHGYGDKDITGADSLL